MFLPYMQSVVDPTCVHSDSRPIPSTGHTDLSSGTTLNRAYVPCACFLPPPLRVSLQGKSLASVTVVGSPDCSDSELEAKVRAHLTEWFDQNKGSGEGAGGLPTRGADVAKWKHLRTYRVPYAQPAQRPPVREGGFFGRKVQVSYTEAVGPLESVFVFRPSSLAFSFPTSVASLCKFAVVFSLFIRDHAVLCWNVLFFFALRTHMRLCFRIVQPTNIGAEINCLTQRQVDDAIFVCGDHRATPTLDGAMKSGVLAGEAVTTDLIAGESRPIVRKGQPYRRRKQVRV